jgi:hypothetical protein
MIVDTVANKSHFRDSLIPDRMDAIDIGSPDNRWRNFYTKSITTADITMSGFLTTSGITFTVAAAPFPTGPTLLFVSNELFIAGGTSGLGFNKNDNTSTFMAISNTGIVSLGNGTTIVGAVSGDLVIPAGNSVRTTVSGSTAIMLRSSSIGGIDFVQLGNGLRACVNVPVTMVGSGIGDLVFASGTSVLGNNNAGSGQVSMVMVNSSDQVVLANTGGDIKWGRANVALGSGGAATLGLVGSSGPAATAQRNWLRFIESDGTASFIPVFR